MDPGVIASCIPGCEGLEPAGERRYVASLKLGMGAIAGRYQGTVALSDIVEPMSYRLTIEGQGAPGFVKGVAEIALRDEGGTTIVDVTAEVHTGGALARVGQRLIVGVARYLQDAFFACMSTKT